MQRTAAALLIFAAATACPAQTQYTLRHGSAMNRETCLPPCLCPSGETAGPMSGSFTMTLLDPNPLYTRYTIDTLLLHVALPGGPVAISGSGIYTIGGEVALLHRLQLDLTIGPLTVITPFDTGLVPADPAYPFPMFAITAISEPICRRETLTIVTGPGPAPCYANCDGSSVAPVLNVADFVCFLSRYAAADPYANCDESTAPPVLNVGDFICFQTRFAAGCP